MKFDSFEPPATADIERRQDELEFLRLLLAQRRLYNRAKAFSLFRTVGFTVVAVAAPIVTAVCPGASVVVGAVAGVWIFMARTVVSYFERHYSSRGAVVQEKFDISIFNMPALGRRTPSVTPEEISQLVGTDADVEAAVAKEDLNRWYPLDQELSGGSSIAIAQRANAAYSERLLNANANVWLAATILWAFTAVVTSLALELELATFLLGVAFPLLPALLDVFEQWRTTRRAGRDRRALADEIEGHLRRIDGKHVTPQDLLVWQDQIYTLRRDSPQIPNLLYKRTRRRNELAMNAAAKELAQSVKDAEHHQEGG